MSNTNFVKQSVALAKVSQHNIVSMFKLNFSKLRLLGPASLSALIGLSMCLLSIANARAQFCEPFLGGGFGLTDTNGAIRSSSTPVHIGDVIRINSFSLVNAS